MILDVGCGDKPQGTVNVDKFRVSTEVSGSLKPFKTKADVIAVGEYLPFKDNSFDLVRSSHTIEHGSDQCKFLAEMVRVSQDEIYVRCPHRYSSIAHGKTHRTFLSGKWFQETVKTLKGINLTIEFTYLYRNFVVLSIP